MGKKSLIKSTTKKKKKEDDQTIPKPSKKASRAKSNTKSEPMPSTDILPVETVLPVDPQELIFRKFPSFHDQPLVKVASRSTAHLTSPEFVTGEDPREVERVRMLLLNRRHTMEEIRAVAIAPEPIQTAPIAANAPEPTVIETVEISPAVETPLVEASSEPAAVKSEIEPPIIAAELSPTATDSLPIEPGVPESFDPPTAEKQVAIQTALPLEAYKSDDPVMRYATYAIAGFVLLLVLLVATSYWNSVTYFISPQQNSSVDIWRGRFSPMGRVFVTTLNGFTLPDPSKTEFERDEILPAMFKHLLKKADELANRTPTPDFAKIRSYLSEAQGYALTKEMLEAVNLRLTTIDLITLLYQTDIAINVGTAESLATALQLLKKSRSLATDPHQIEMIKHKQAVVEERTLAIGAPNTKTPTPSVVNTHPSTVTQSH